MARNSDLLAEAMRAGPCIGTHGAAEELVEHGVFGYVMNPSSPDDLFDYMKALFLDSSLRTQMEGARVAAIQVVFHC